MGAVGSTVNNLILHYDACNRVGIGLAVLSENLLLCLKFRNHKFVKFEFSVSDLNLDRRSYTHELVCVRVCMVRVYTGTTELSPTQPTDAHSTTRKSTRRSTISRDDCSVYRLSLHTSDVMISQLTETPYPHAFVGADGPLTNACHGETS